MKKKEYVPDMRLWKALSNLCNQAKTICRQRIRKVLKETLTTNFTVEADTLWDVLMESAYVDVTVNDSGEYTYSRREKVAGAGIKTVDGVRVTYVITEAGNSVNIEYMTIDDLASTADLLNEIATGLKNGSLRVVLGEVISDMTDDER